MKNVQKFNFALWVMLGLMAFPVLSYAEITVSPDFEGSLVITSPDGTTEIFNSGDKLPVITSGSTITVMGGEAEISTGGDEKVNCNCLGANFDLPGASAVKLTCGTKTGNLEVTKGTTVVKSPAGDEKNLNSGDQYPIAPGDSNAAEPTAAGESFGITPPGDSEPNSRDMAVSPGQ